jgi:hypothetical protein
MDGQGSIPGSGKKYNLFSITPRQVLRTHTTSYPVGTGNFLPGVKRPGREADHSPPASTEVKNGGAVPHPLIRLHGVVLN